MLGFTYINEDKLKGDLNNGEHGNESSRCSICRRRF